MGSSKPPSGPQTSPRVKAVWPSTRAHTGLEASSTGRSPQTMLSFKYRQLFVGMKYCMGKYQNKATFWWGERLTTLQGPSAVKTQYTHCQEVLQQIGKAPET